MLTVLMFEIRIFILSKMLYLYLNCFSSYYLKIFCIIRHVLNLMALFIFPHIFLSEEGKFELKLPDGKFVSFSG